MISASQDHQPPPEFQQLRKRGEQRTDAEKLRAPMLPREVVHAHLHHVAAAQLQLANQLHADGPAGRREMDLVQQVAPYEPVVAVDIAYTDAEKQPRAEIVNRPD